MACFSGLMESIYTLMLIKPNLQGSNLIAREPQRGTHSRPLDLEGIFFSPRLVSQRSAKCLVQVDGTVAADNLPSKLEAASGYRIQVQSRWVVVSMRQMISQHLLFPKKWFTTKCVWCINPACCKVTALSRPRQFRKSPLQSEAGSFWFNLQ